MRMLMHVKFENARFNAATLDGTVGRTIQRILEETKPEAAYFTEYDGRRGVILVVNVEEPSRVPALAEPWFLLFDADVQFHIAMKPEELARAGIEAIAKKWS